MNILMNNMKGDPHGNNDLLIKFILTYSVF